MPKKDILDFTTSSITLGIGTAAVASIGQGATILPAFATTGRMMGITGTAMMGGNALRIVSKMGKTKRKKRRR